jgi:uncharacterized protein YkwD
VPIQRRKFSYTKTLAFGLAFSVCLPAIFCVAAQPLVAGQNNFPRFTERSIPPALASILCERNAVAEDFVKNGLFDAQVEVLLMKPKDPAPKELTAAASQRLLTMIQRRALEVAEKSEQLGYAFGICADGAAWAVTFPAPFPIIVADGELNIPAQAGKETCSKGSISVLYVSESKGRAVAVPLSRNLTAKLPERPGYIGVMCTANAFPNSGPREWAIIPVAGVTAHVETGASASGSSTETLLLAWINEKRKAELLTPLVLDKEFSAAAAGLVAGRKIHHDIHALTLTRMALVRSGREPFGENRVAGRTVSELENLLWMSPAHRNLILNPAADAAGITVSQDSHGMFSVIIVGHKVAGPVASLKNPL